MAPTMLTEESFQAARRFIETTARPLEIARLHHAFDGEPGEAVFDALRRYQNTDGSWAPTWSWGDAFPNDWPAARREWTGVITLEKLLLLKRFARISRQ